MFKNYLIIAFRTLWKHRIVTAINVLGLSIGISASLVIYLLVNYHFSFDKFEKDHDRIYRVVSAFDHSGNIFYNSGVTTPLGRAVKKELTGLEAVIPFRNWYDAKVSVPAGNKQQSRIFKHQDELVFADKDFMDFIGYHWLSGSPQSAMLQPYQAVLTKSAAALYFPNLQPAQVVGKLFYIDDTIAISVSGIVQDIPANTDFTFNTFISKPTLENTSLRPGYYDNWDVTTGESQLYVKLAGGTDPEQVRKGIMGLYDRYHKKNPGDNSKANFVLQPLSDVHFNADYGAYNIPTTSKEVLYSLLAVAAFLLILGCINFINLTTARSTQRAKEIGIRKTIGGSKKQLIFQFLSETFLLTLIATVFSALLTPLILKAFAGFIPADLSFNIIARPEIIVFLCVLMITVTFLSGFYPAMVLSGYKPVWVLKNQVRSATAHTRNAWLRKSLTVSQFVIAQFFIMATLFVGKQISYSLNKNLGFRKDAIVYFPTPFHDGDKSKKQTFLNKLNNIPEIAMVSLCNNPPSSESTWSGVLTYKDGKKEIETDVQLKYADTNYIKLYGLTLLAGHNLTQSDSTKELIINETYAHILGFQDPQQAVGKQINWGDKPVPVAGVVADFNQKSLHEPIKPLIITNYWNQGTAINVLLQPRTKDGTTWKRALAKIESSWKATYPDEDFEYNFFDESIAKYYTQEQNISSLLKWATILAVLISCLGLLGLVMFTTSQRFKEIGVRKVLGATVSQIVALISKDFIALVLIAFVIAAPLAWLGINKWLQNFAYRTDISWWVFAVAGLLMVIMALFTLSFQTIRAAVSNPVKSLRTE